MKTSVFVIVLVTLGLHGMSVWAQERPTLTPIPPPPTATSTPQPTDTPEPTATRYPTYTPYPTYTFEPTDTVTPYPTQTPYPTWTAAPTQRPVLPTVVLATPQPTVRPYPTRTATPYRTRTTRPTATRTATATPDWERVREATRRAWEQTKTAQPTATPFPTATANQTATQAWKETRWAETKTARPTPTDTPTFTPTSTKTVTPTITPNYRATQEERSRIWKMREGMKDEGGGVKKTVTATIMPTTTTTTTTTTITTETVTPTITETVVVTPTGISVEDGVLSRPTATPDINGEIYAVVQAGDTAIGIAVQHGIDLDQLLAQNGLDRGSMIRPGDRLLVLTSQPQPIEPQPMAAPTPEPMQAEIMPFSGADCQLSIEAFEDGNSDKQRQPGEGISDLLILIVESQQAWTVKRYTDDGRVQLAVPCEPLELEVPYLFERRPVTKVELERGMVVQFVETAAIYPRMLP